MAGPKALTPKALRKLKRKLENEELAKIARFWRKPGSANLELYGRPVNRQARNALFGKK